MANELSSRSDATTITERTFKGVGDLIKLLPSGTVFLFQFLSPLLTNVGQCATVNRWLSGVLLVVCAFNCSFACFTDSFLDAADGKLYYGIVTARGIWLFSDPGAAARNNDLSKYKLRLGDFAHAALSLLVFVAVALLDNNTVTCFYPALLVQEKTLVTALPPVIGAVAGVVFVLFPQNRNGIGYPPTGTAASEKSVELNEGIGNGK